MPDRSVWPCLPAILSHGRRIRAVGPLAANFRGCPIFDSFDNDEVSQCLFRTERRTLNRSVSHRRFEPSTVATVWRERLAFGGLPLSLSFDDVSQEKPASLAGLSHLPRGGELPKALTGIRGLDEITRGGLPKGRPTLVCGGPGSGKTLAGAHLSGERRPPFRRAGRAHDVRGKRRGDCQRRRVARF